TKTWPRELAPTPATSPTKIGGSSGAWRNPAFAVKGISGTAWAASAPNGKPGGSSRSAVAMRRRVMALLLSPGRGRRRLGRRVEPDLLRPPVVDLRRVDHVRVAAVHLVDRRELARRLAGAAELADDRPVELELVDLARVLGLGRGRAV